jgi:hypothetical protein
VGRGDVPGGTDPDRRQFLGRAGIAALGVGAAQFGVSGHAPALAGAGRTAGAPGARPKASAYFGPVKQVNAGVLNVGYVEAGPPGGRAVVLMHGFPYDIHSYAEVAPLLAAEGYRVVVPYFRGYGTTTFLSGSIRQSWPVMTGGRGRPTSLLRCGRTGSGA